MITKIEKLKNIGNFEDYNAKGDVTLKKLRGQGTGTEVNPQSWTQLKGSHETQIKFRRKACSD